MPRPPRSPGLCVALLVGCTLPNPAYHVTQGQLESSTGDSQGASDSQGPGTAAEPTTTSQGTSATTTGPTSEASDTENTGAPPVTTSPGTTGDGPGTTASSATSDGPDSTSMAASDTLEPKLDLGMEDVCALVNSPNLGLAVQHSVAPDCNYGPALTLVFEAKPDDHTLKFRECMFSNDCFAGNLQCSTKQTLALKVEGPASHVPEFEAGACVHLSYISTGYADGNTCNARMVRLAKTGQNIKNTSVFVAATGVPATAGLPIPWPQVLEFSVDAELAQACPGGEVCGQATGSYDLFGQFGGEQIVVPTQTEKPVHISLLDKQNVKVGEVPGGLYNLRSYAAAPAQCEFDWIWLADEARP